ncbi:transposase domain-containing protein [Bradyrhizobium sp. 45]|uniref:transposase domain-containing protein n=1 Tax=Bradyrhizobium sp. 45 TaxID=1043587 RepID=UPI001FF73F57|nr:transposase domain-containing protein [Bradyrhizobium sp. 45]
MLASVVAACKLNDVNPVAYIAETLESMIAGHPQSKIEHLMPWRFFKEDENAEPSRVAREYQATKMLSDNSRWN